MAQSSFSALWTIVVGPAVGAFISLLTQRVSQRWNRKDELLPAVQALLEECQRLEELLGPRGKWPRRRTFYGTVPAPLSLHRWIEPLVPKVVGVRPRLASRMVSLETALHNYSLFAERHHQVLLIKQDLIQKKQEVERKRRDFVASQLKGEQIEMPESLVFAGERDLRKAEQELEDLKELVEDYKGKALAAIADIRAELETVRAPFAAKLRRTLARLIGRHRRQS